MTTWGKYPPNLPAPAVPPVVVAPPVEPAPAPPVTQPPVTATKSWVALVGTLLSILIPLILQVTAGLPDPWPAIVGGVVGLLTVLGVYQVPNKPLATTPEK